MPYILAKDFKKGLTQTRARVAGDPGTLWDLKNAHITRGGDIERSKRFTPAYTLPAGTFGLSQVKGQLYVFGSADLASSMPAGVQYQRLVPGDGSSMANLLDAKSFDGNLFAIAEFDNGTIGAFYNGSRQSSLDTLADANSSFSTLADYLAAKINTRTDVAALAFGGALTITAQVPGTAFTISAATTNGGANPDQTATVTTLQPNVVAIPEVQAKGNVEITYGTPMAGVNQVLTVLLNGVNILPAPVNFVGDIATTANIVASAINAGGLTTYAASVDGTTGKITLTAPAGLGATANGTTTAITVSGPLTTLQSNVSGGVTAVAATAQVTQVALGGTYEALDTFTITINGTAYVATGRASGHVTSAFVYKKRIYAVAGSLLRYCAIGAPTDWTTVTPASGSSFINLNSDSEGSERLVAIEQYQTYVAIYSRRRTVLYALNTDATTNTFVQTLQNTGTLAPRSVVAYGNTDVFYLDETGIRSIKARDASNAAFVSDVGTAIDTFVRSHIYSLSADVVQRAIGLVEPIDGRFWLSIGSRIYILSYYPSTKIEAWSYYDLGSTIDGMVRAFNRVYVRQGTAIKLYGGFSGQDYPLAGEQVVTAKLPFLAADDPSSEKMDYGFDIACTNQWTVYALPDPSDESKSTLIGRPIGPSFVGPGANQGVALATNVVAFDFTCDTAGYASLSSFSFAFNKGSAG